MEQPPVNCVASLCLFILWSSLNKCLSMCTQTYHSTHTHNRQTCSRQTCLDTPTHFLLLFLQSSHPLPRNSASHTLGTISPSFLWYAAGEKSHKCQVLTSCLFYTVYYCVRFCTKISNRNNHIIKSKRFD